MMTKLKHIWQLTILYCVVLLSGILILSNTSVDLALNTYILISTVMTLITLAAYILIMIGMRKDERASGIYLIAGLGGKFLAYLILILIYWLSVKIVSGAFIIAFFILYLLLTFFLIRILYKELKTN